MSQGRASLCQTPLTDSRIPARFANCNTPFNQALAADGQARERPWAFVHRSWTLGKGQLYTRDGLHRLQLHSTLTGAGYILGPERRCKVLQNRCLWDRSRLPQIFETPLLMLHVVAGPY